MPGLSIRSSFVLLPDLRGWLWEFHHVPRVSVVKTELRSEQRLIRGIGLREGISLNVIEMIGIGPFITIPLIVHAAGGPQAMLGWIFGAVLAMCDGMVWAELGAALPRAGVGPATAPTPTASQRLRPRRRGPVPATRCGSPGRGTGSTRG